jgi:hypothetical protein
MGGREMGAEPTPIKALVAGSGGCQTGASQWAYIAINGNKHRLSSSQTVNIAEYGNIGTLTGLHLWNHLPRITICDAG